MAVERNNRRWAMVAIKAIEAYGHEPSRQDLVQTALDDMAIAVCRRLTRIFRSDLGPERDE